MAEAGRGAGGISGAVHVDRSRFRQLRPSLILAAAAAIVFAGCTPTLAHPVGFVSLRNESPQPVRVEIDRPNDWPWSLFGPQQQVAWVPTWQAGWCPAAMMGLSDQGTADSLPASLVTLSGPSLPQPTTFPGVAMRIQTGGLAVAIDPAGTVHVVDAQASLSPGCESYPLGTAP